METIIIITLLNLFPQCFNISESQKRNSEKFWVQNLKFTTQLRKKEACCLSFMLFHKKKWL